jgi:pimeloyl-ACP methyl ester carboxylesterase
MVKIPHTMQGKLVTFIATDKLILNGFLVEGKRAKRCIIYVHGMTGNFYHGLLAKTLAEKALRHGYSSFLINTRGHDALSSGRFMSGARKRVRIGTLVEKFEDCIKDIDGAIKFLKSKGYKEFILAGHSTGCQKILYYQYLRKRRDVRALLLLAPDDDYNLNRKELGRRWGALVKEAKSLSRAKRGMAYNIFNPRFPFAPARFLSVADPKRIEARLFNYDGKLAEFSRVKTPMYVVFGTKDEGAVKPVEEYVSILWERTSSRNYGSLIIKNARHSFSEYESVVADSAMKWLQGLK